MALPVSFFKKKNGYLEREFSSGWLQILTWLKLASISSFCVYLTSAGIIGFVPLQPSLLSVYKVSFTDIQTTAHSCSPLSSASPFFLSITTTTTNSSPLCPTHTYVSVKNPARRKHEICFLPLSPSRVLAFGTPGLYSSETSKLHTSSVTGWVKKDPREPPWENHLKVLPECKLWITLLKNAA